MEKGRRGDRRDVPDPPKVMVESLGAGDGFRGLYISLQTKYPIKMIRVYADPDTCLRRVKNRNNADHISVSDDQVAEYNKIAASVSYDWDMEINNNAPAADGEILNAIRSINE